MLEKTLKEQAEALRRGDFSSEELTRIYLERIETAADINCMISVDDTALDQAKTADAAIASGDTRPLLGIPIAHKDIFCQTGTRTSAGSRMLDNFIAPYDATVVTNLKEAGAITIGKTNMDEFAMGSSNENSYYGVVKNPWRKTHVPGGSSGGSAAAVAARLCSAATGTDTGGSIRQPAAFCGVTGLKPTYGRISRWGMIAYASSLDQAGPIAGSAEDCALLLASMAGHDPRDSTSSPTPVHDYLGDLNQSLEGLKVGLCTEYMADLPGDMQACLQEVMTSLQSLGAVLSEVSLPSTAMAIPAYYIIAPAECSANLARYDGVRFGYRCENPADLADLYRRSRSEALGPEVKNRILLGTFALSAGYIDAYYRKAQQIRRLIKNDFLAAFQQADIIIGPTTPGPAFGIGEKSDDQLAMYLQDIYTISANLAGLPAMSMPAGFIDGLPVGIQLIGNYFDEAKLLNVAHRYQQVSDWHRQVPEGFQ